jgi:hypothetical protein
MRPLPPSAKARRISQQQPRRKWQTGPYSRYVEWEGTLPYSFLLIAKLVGVTPHDLVTDFMDNLSSGSWNRQDRDAAKEKLVDYFLAHGYGQAYYTVEDIRTMFGELDAIGRLWPGEGSPQLMELHAKWRDQYYDYWFQKWYGKVRRRL